ncbi:MAG: hypothetical protein AAFR96_12840 [Planctomycetota bacterium]
MFDLVIAVDWSAASSPGPVKPSEQRPWIAAGSQGDRDEPSYHRTRSDALARIIEILSDHRGTCLIGLDFAFGYPNPEIGPLLPTGRGLCSLFDARLTDQPNDHNDRFELAAELNRDISERVSGPGPFWGCPAANASEFLSTKKPETPSIPEYRMIDAHLRSRGERPQSPWKLAYAGSVGSQVFTGLKAVHQITQHPALAHRCKIWPFETGWAAAALAGRNDSIVIAEIYPTLAEHRPVDHPIKDARQVVAQRDLILDATNQAALLEPPASLTDAERHTAQHHEGWILGVND